MNPRIKFCSRHKRLVLQGLRTRMIFFFFSRPFPFHLTLSNRVNVISMEKGRVLLMGGGYPVTKHLGCFRLQRFFCVYGLDRLDACLHILLHQFYRSITSSWSARWFRQPVAMFIWKDVKGDKQTNN